MLVNILVDICAFLFYIYLYWYKIMEILLCILIFVLHLSLLSSNDPFKS